VSWSRLLLYRWCLQPHGPQLGPPRLALGLHPKRSRALLSSESRTPIPDAGASRCQPIVEPAGQTWSPISAISSARTPASSAATCRGG
jgi:hypothetical protein